MRRNMLRFLLVLVLCLLLPLGAVAEDWGLDFSQPVKNPLWLALTNASEPLAADFEPQNLTPVSPKMDGVHLVTSRAVLMEQEALSHLYELVAAAQAEEIELFIRQGYRSWEDEERRYKSLVSAGSPAQAAGQSSYQTGLSVTLVSREHRTGDLTADFADTKEAKWLALNAHRFGFALRYPQGKDTLTGWSYEPWHYRYVGLELAQAMQAYGLCLEEVRQVYDRQQSFVLTSAPAEKAEEPAVLLTPAPQIQIEAEEEASGSALAPLDGLAALVEDASHILLSNAAEPLPAQYVPENLAPVSPKMAGVNLVTSRALVLEETALNALYELLAAADGNGLTLFIRQGYRSYADEERRYESLAAKGEKGQRPGESSYQTGLSVTLVNKEYRTADLSADFAQSQEGKWLLENCSAYGFVLRYPQGKENITGWEYEPWHFRYVGKALAQKMAAENLCLEELRQDYDADYAYVMPVVAEPTPVPTATPRPKAPATPNPWIEYYSTGEVGPDGDYEIELFPGIE